MDIALNIALVVVTFLTGVALVVFDWRTYRLSKQVTELRYSPVLDVYPMGPPKTGSFEVRQYKYHGVKWEILLTNPGDVPITASDISVFLKVTPPYDDWDGIWTGVGKLCELLDEEGNILADRAIGVNGRSQRKITVFLCREDNRPEQHKLFKPGDTAVMSVDFFQRGGLGKQSGRLVERSEPFQLPEKFDREPFVHLV